MDYQSVPMLGATNFHEWRDKVKIYLMAYGPEVWKLVCDGYYKGSPSLQEQQWNAKEKCVMYTSLHNKDLDTVVDLTSTKEIWNRSHLMHEGYISGFFINKEKINNKKKKPFQKEKVQSNEVPSSVNGHDCHG